MCVYLLAVCLFDHLGYSHVSGRFRGGGVRGFPPFQANHKTWSTDIMDSHIRSCELPYILVETDFANNTEEVKS